MKRYVLIVIAVVLIIILVCLGLNKDKNNNSNSSGYKKYDFKNITYSEAEEGGYIVMDSATNQVITTVQNEGELKKYQDNPEYNKFAPSISTDEDLVDTNETNIE